MLFIHLMPTMLLLLQLIALLLISPAHGDTRCPLQISPQSVVVRYGSSVSANCSTSVPHNGMGWESTVGGAVPMSRDSLITWKVSRLTEWNIEPPFCFINFINGEQCQTDLPVTIYKPPDSVSISTVNHTGPMIAGNQYELQCDVQNVAPVQNLTVRWYKEQTLVNQTFFNDTIRTPVNKMAKLLINPDRDDNGVQYRCEAELDLGEEGPQPPPKVKSQTLTLTVYFPPYIECQHWSTVRGTSLDSYPNLKYVGNPFPNISWTRKSSPVNTSKHLTKNDSDQYEIIAINELGNFSCMINIAVEYPPELNCPQNYTVKEGTRFSDPCKSDGLPKPDLHLYKDGKIIQDPFLPKWNDSGWYQLNASNTRGYLISNISLNILYGPRLYTNSDKFVVTKDDSITLVCNSSGNPEPEVSLSFQDNTVATGRRCITYKIEGATSTSAGVYTCSAKNEIGLENKTFTVEIKDKSSNNYIIFVVAALVVLLIILLLYIYVKWSKSTGSYEVTPQEEMRPLSNGGLK